MAAPSEEEAADILQAPTPETRFQKLGGYDFYRTTLKSPRFIVAPMVDQSETAWRMLCRRYKADLCYTPMYHSRVLAADGKYRQECAAIPPEDRPVIAQV